MSITGKTILGTVFLATGLGIIVGNELRGHPWDHVVLGVAVGLMVIGAHFISNTAVRDALTDIGTAVKRFWPFGSKTGEHQQPPDSGGG